RTNEIYHINNKETSKTILAKLDDIAYLLQSLIHAYTITSNEMYLKNISYVVNYAISNFNDEQNIMFYFSDAHQRDIVVRKIDVYDGATVSSNAVMCECLWWYGQMTN